MTQVLGIPVGGARGYRLRHGETGLVTMIGGLLGLAAQTPIGAAIDETRAKRGAIILALAVLAVGGVTIFALPSFWPVMAANGLMAVVGDVFGPAVAALTLGLYARNCLKLPSVKSPLTCRSVRFRQRAQS